MIKFAAAAEIPSNAQAVGVPVFEGLKSVTSGVELDTRYLRTRGFEGRKGQVESVMADDGTTIVALGLGPRGGVSVDGLRDAAARLARAVPRARRVATTLLDTAGSAGLDLGAGAAAVAEGLALAAYDFGSYKSSSTPSAIERVTVVGADRDALAAGLARGARAAEAVCLARDLVNEPAAAMTPRRLAEVATEVGESGGLEVEIWDEERIEAERLGGLRGVSLGSAEPPRLISLRYSPDSASADGDGGDGGAAAGPLVTLVGKGITFDSGGLSIKTGDGMMTMKTDMSGAAAVIATMSALRDLGVGVRVRGIVPATENMPGGRAIKPGDVLRFRNGKTAEVLNTDAEGRLVLADGLSLAAEERPDAIIDLATLTGAQVVALGPSIAGLMGNDEALIGRVTAASQRAGEATWPLPLPDAYRKHIDSEIADMKNIGQAGKAGTLVAGLFLKEFVGDVPWAHLDIAGPARSEEDSGWLRKGGTGFGVRTLLELLSGWSASPGSSPAPLA